MSMSGLTEAGCRPKTFLPAICITTFIVFAQAFMVALEMLHPSVGFLVR